MFDYMQVFFAEILGYFVLDQIPEILSFVGYAVIIGAAIGQWAYHLVYIGRTSHSYMVIAGHLKVISQPPFPSSCFQSFFCCFYLIQQSVACAWLRRA